MVLFSKKAKKKLPVDEVEFYMSTDNQQNLLSEDSTDLGDEGYFDSIIRAHHKGGKAKHKKVKTITSLITALFFVLLLICCLCFCCIVCIAAIYCVSYTILGYVEFDELFLAGPTKSNCVASDSPQNYTAHGGCAPIDTSNRDFSNYTVDARFVKTVNFQSRDPDWTKRDNSANINAFIFENDRSRPYIIVVHGYRVCKTHFSTLFQGSVAWKNGYNALVLDLRNHGESDYYKFQKPYTTFGSEEHKDILGAIDYIKSLYVNDTENTPSIGVLGNSLGGATSIIATQRSNGDVKCLFLDSPPTDVKGTLGRGIESIYGLKGLGGYFYDASCWAAPFKSIFGCAPFKISPMDVLSKYEKGFPIHIEHTYNDIVVPMDINTEKITLPELIKVGSNVTHTFVNSGINSNEFGKCDNHLWNLLVDMDSYAERMNKFFKTHLPY